MNIVNFVALIAILASSFRIEKLLEDILDELEERKDEKC